MNVNKKCFILSNFSTNKYVIGFRKNKKQKKQQETNDYFLFNKWAVTSENVPSDMCAQRTYRSAGAFAQIIRIFTVSISNSQECKTSSWTAKTDQTARMHRLIWVLIWRTYQRVRFLMLRLNIFINNYIVHCINIILPILLWGWGACSKTENF